MIIEEIENGLLKIEAESKEKRAKGKKAPAYHPSAASVRIDGKTFGKCLRGVAYDQLGYPQEPMTAKSLWAINMGNWIHSGIQNAYLKHNPEAKVESSFTVDLGLSRPIRGRMDIFLDEQKIALEIKTCYGRALSGANGLKRKPKPDHLVQIMFYVNALKLNGGELLYIARDSAYRTSYDVKPGDILFKIEKDYEYVEDHMYKFTYQRIIDRFKELDSFVAKNELPPREYNARCWQCEYFCNHTEKCWASQ